MAIDFKVTFTGGSPEDRKNDDFKVEDTPQTSERDSGDASTSGESEMKIPSLNKTKDKEESTGTFKQITAAKVGDTLQSNSNMDRDENNAYRKVKIVGETKAFFNVEGIDPKTGRSVDFKVSKKSGAQYGTPSRRYMVPAEDEIKQPSKADIVKQYLQDKGFPIAPATNDINTPVPPNSRQKLTAKQQRDLFGYVPFGKKSVQFREDVVNLQWSTSFGTDGDFKDISYEDLIQGKTDDGYGNTIIDPKFKQPKKLTEYLDKINLQPEVEEEDAPSQLTETPSPVSATPTPEVDYDYPPDWDDIEDDATVENKELEVNSVSDEDLIKQALQDTPEASIMPMAKLRDIAGIPDSDRFNNAILNLEKEGYLDLTKHPDIGNESPSRVSTFVPFRDGYAENIIKRTQPKIETPKKPVDPPVEKKPKVTIEPAFRQTKTGKDVKDGYDVFIDDEWHERYPTKKAAKAAITSEPKTVSDTPKKKDDPTAQPIGDSLIFDPSRTVSDTSNKTPGPQSMLADIDFQKQKDKKAKEAKRKKKAATPEPESNLLSNINDNAPSVPNDPAPSIPEALREITNDAVKDLFDYAASGGGGGDEPPVKTTFDMPDPEDDDSDDPESLLKFAETNTDPDPTPRIPNKKDADAPLFEFADANEDDGYADLPDVKSVMPDVTKPEVMGNFQKELDKIAAKERKALQVALTQAKRRADKQTKVKARRYEKEQGKRRRKIDNESKIRKAEILESNKRADSDRMIRRLTTFGIGRAVGIDGGMLTALAELFVFQPEADKEQAELDKRLKEVQDDRAGQIADLDKAKTLTAENRDWQSVDIAEIIDDARLRLGDEENPTQLPDVERELASVLNKNLNVFSAKDQDDLYTGPIDIVGKKSPSIDPTERNHKDSVTTADEASDSSKTPPRTASGDDPSVSGPGASQTQQNANTAATGASSGGGSGGSGGNVPPTVSGNPPSPAGKGGGGGGFINNIVSLFGSNLSSATGKLLVAQIALQSLATASDLAEAGIKKIGTAIDDPFSVQSQNATVGLGGDLSKATGTVAGGAIGAVMGGPMGAVAGAIVGKAVSSAIIDPLITFVETGTQQLDSLAKQSIGSRTIQSRVDQSIEKLVKRMELSDRLDDTTSMYVDTQTDLGSALSDFKGTLAELFGPTIVTIMKSAAVLVKIAELIILLAELTPIVKAIQIYQQANNWFIEQILNLLEWALSWFRSSNNVTNQAMLNSVYGFFGNNASQAVQGSATTFRNTFAGGNAGFNP